MHLFCISWFIFATTLPCVFALTLKGDEPRGVYNRPNSTTVEYQIKNYILTQSTYDKTSRPVANPNKTVQVNIGVSLYHILDTDEKSQTISTVFAIRIKWFDDFLVWDPKDFGGIKTVWIPSDKIWKKKNWHINLLNRFLTWSSTTSIKKHEESLFLKLSADRNYDSNFKTNVVVSSVGKVLWMYPALVKTSCTLNVRYFPFDYQQCEIEFISWTYSGIEVNLTTNEMDDNNTNYYNPDNQEWSVPEILADRHVKKYACCEEPFPDITMVLCMSRRSMFYIYNLIFPCCLMHVVSMMSFWIPVESNDKVSLLVTILLAMVVFLMVIGELMPPTPDAIPLIGVLFTSIMVLVAFSLGVAIVATNYFFRKSLVSRPPVILRCLFINWWPLTPLNLTRRIWRKCCKPCCYKSRRRRDSRSPLELARLNGTLSNRGTAGCSIEGTPMRSPTYTGSSQRRGSVFRGMSDLEMEWPLVGKRIEQFCFYVFIAMSLTVYLYIIIQIPRSHFERCTQSQGTDFKQMRRTDLHADDHD